MPLIYFSISSSNSKRGINARNRGLKFSIPYATPISAHVRLVAEEADLTSLESILQEGLIESSCSGVSSDDLVLYYNDMLAGEIGRLEVQLKKGVRSSIKNNLSYCRILICSICAQIYSKFYRLKWFPLTCSVDI